MLNESKEPLMKGQKMTQVVLIDGYNKSTSFALLCLLFLVAKDEFLMSMFSHYYDPAGTNLLSALALLVEPVMGKGAKTGHSVTPAFPRLPRV